MGNSNPPCCFLGQCPRLADENVAIWSFATLASLRATLTKSALGALVLIPSSARAEEQVVRLKQAPGLDAVEGQCGACHSLDYIVTNSPFLDRRC